MKQKTSPEIRPNFFDAISKASMEAMHSAALAWIIDHKGSEALSPAEKATFVNSLFNTEFSEDAKLKAVTEYMHIDILVYDITPNEGNNNRERTVLTIENKIRSKQGRDQLEKYEKVVEQDENLSKYERKQFCFLTLADEQAGSEGWSNVRYKELKEALQSFVNKKKKDRDVFFLEEYYQAVSNLVTVKEAFLKEPWRDEFCGVFEECTLSTSKKIRQTFSLQEDGGTQISEMAAFIRKNNLETVLYAAFLRKIYNEIHGELSNLGPVSIDETRGRPLLDFHNDAWKITCRGVKFNLGIEYQETFKIQVFSKKEDLDEPEISIILETCHEKIFEKIKEKKPQFSRFNAPGKKGKSWGKAYFSVSKKGGKAFKPYDKKYSSKEGYEKYKIELVTILKECYEIVLMLNGMDCS